MSQKKSRQQVGEINYDADNLIGGGGFAEVFRGTWLAAPVVIKLLGLEALSSSYDQKLFLHELRVWKPLNHPHILKLYAACFSGKLCFVCEDATHGTLLEYLRTGENKSKVWQKLYEAALGLQFLHSQDVVHNDLKCDNLLVGADEKTKIADFGLACILNSVEVLIAPKKQGALWWRSPEYLRGERVTLASDIYSFAICILEAVTGEVPRKNQIGPAVKFQVLRGRLPLRPDGMSASQWSLVEAMLCFEPAGRPQIVSVVETLRVFFREGFPANSVGSTDSEVLEQLEGQLDVTSTRKSLLGSQLSTALPHLPGHAEMQAASLLP
ncbi:Serine/threonine protein kinase, partial [Globisporangium polare]